MLKVEKRNKREVLEGIDRRINKLQQMVEHAGHTLNNLRQMRDELEKEIKNDREVMDTESPNCGSSWSRFERETLEDRFQDFLYGYAKKFGRSTLAIRYKVIEFIGNKVGNTDIDKMVNLLEIRRK